MEFNYLSCEISLINDGMATSNPPKTNPNSTTDVCNKAKYESRKYMVTAPN